MIMDFVMKICFAFLMVLILPTNADTSITDLNKQLMLLAQEKQNHTSEMVSLLNDGANVNFTWSNGVSAVYLVMI